MQDAPGNGSNATASKPSNSCMECKKRHLRCDSDRPACANCRNNDTECVRSLSVRFRHSLNPSVRSQRVLEASKREYNFAHDQTWVKTNRALSFVNETPDVVHLHDASVNGLDNVSVNNAAISPESGAYTAAFASSPSSQVSKGSSEPLRDSPRISRPMLDEERPRKRRTLSSNSSEARPQPASSSALQKSSSHPQSAASGPHPAFSGVSPFGPDGPSPTTVGSEINEPQDPRGAIAKTLSGIYLEAPNWPLKDPQEAYLFRYFTENVAPLLDLCDSLRHFTTVVPRRAVLCPPLMNAMFAASAKRLSRVSNFDGYVVDKYHQNCLSALIPALSSSAAIMDENLLTAIVILRFMEELDVPIASTVAESHLVGTRVFMAAQEKIGNFTGLRLAAFWLALRQEIHIAFIQARPIHPNFSFDDVTRLIHPNDSDCSFANQAIMLCASCIKYCYGTDEQSVGVWDKLKESSRQWWDARPWSFCPLLVREDGEERFFPEEMYLNDAVVTGVQHHYLGRVLLEAHNPRVPRLGPGQAMAFRTANESIKRLVRAICGIAESNPRTVPAYANACIAITMAGDRFTEPHEQQLLYNILTKTDTQYGWPTRSTRQHLREAWGWAEASRNGAMPLTNVLNRNFQ